MQFIWIGSRLKDDYFLKTAIQSKVAPIEFLYFMKPLKRTRNMTIVSAGFYLVLAIIYAYASPDINFVFLPLIALTPALLYLALSVHITVRDIRKINLTIATMKPDAIFIDYDIVASTNRLELGNTTIYIVVNRMNINRINIVTVKLQNNRSLARCKELHLLNILQDYNSRDMISSFQAINRYFEEGFPKMKSIIIHENADEDEVVANFDRIRP